MLLDVPRLESFKMKTNMLVNSKSIMQPELRIDFQVLRKSVLVLRAVNHKLRQEMIRLINQEGKMTVTDLYVKLRLEQSVASQHLALLRRAGVVYTLRDGKYIYYSIDHDRLEEISRLMNELVK
jgi:DNA-binding transcriptional ArsR family regulator